MLRILLPILFLALPLMTGCAPAEREPLFALSRLMIRVDGTVPAGAVDRFFDQHLLELFPSGVTRLDGQQQWRNPDGSATTAPCVVFDIIHLASTDNATRIDGAVLIAKRQFGPGAVVLVQGRPDVRF